MADNTASKPPSTKDWNQLRSLVEQANAGDAAALAKLREFLDRHPQVWGHLGDLARVAETAWLQLISGGDALTAESVRRQLAHLKQEIVGETPAAIEKLLADAVVATWLELRYMEAATADGTGGSMMQAGLFLKKLESAQRRHLAAIKSLVQTRKLLPNPNTLPELRIFPREESA